MPKTKLIVAVSLLTALIIAIWWFTNPDKLVLRKSTFSGVDEIDTIDVFPGRGIYMLQVIRNGALGHFSMDLAFEKVISKSTGQRLRYEVANKLHYRVSKDFVSLMDPGMEQHGWGWFYLVKGRVQDNLPGMKEIQDSIANENKQYYISESRGYIHFIVNGKQVKQLNYGNLITKYNQLNFDSLDYKLYKLEGDNLVIVSNNGNDLLKQKNGLYFVPSPGYGVKYNYNKDAVLDLIDSVSRSFYHPSILRVNPVQ